MRGWPRRNAGASDPPSPLDYDAVFRRTADSVYRVCLAVLHDPVAAEDAKMDVFKKLLTRPPKRVDGGIEGWLRTAARTTAIDHLRALRPHRPLEDAFEVPDPRPTPEELALDDDLRRSLRERLGVLSPAQRQVIELRLEGLNGNEIAHLLDRTRGWVDTTAFRAMQKLQRATASTPAGKEGTR